MKYISLFISTLLLAGCSMFGNESVKIAPYEVIESAKDKKIEVRHYNSLILASTSMVKKEGEDRNGAFYKLFNYISGENVNNSKISMTAPVFMDDENDAKDGQKIAMTAPVFMDDRTDGQMMSFVLPAEFTIENAPKPKNPEVVLSEVKDYTVAAIIFNGRLKDKNIEKHKKILQQWIDENNHTATGPAKTAGYNSPFTLPAFRRNEVLIPIKRP